MHTNWHDDPTANVEPLTCHCCTPANGPMAPEEPPNNPLAAYETQPLDATQFSAWARATALETATHATPATLGEHIDYLILKLRAIQEGSEPLNTHHIPDAL